MVIKAYTDGSYQTGDCVYGAGVVIKNDKDDNELTLVNAGDDNNISRLRNVAGELLAVFLLFQYLDSLKETIDEVHIYHDYEGVSKWALGQWKTNKEFTKFYAMKIQEYMKKYKVIFHHVKGHSGVYLNEKADKAAKRAVKEFIWRRNNAR